MGFSFGAGLFEGDDGIFSLNGDSRPIPAEQFDLLVKNWQEQASKLGFKCKYLLKGPAWKIGFCALHYEPQSK